MTSYLSINDGNLHLSFDHTLPLSLVVAEDDGLPVGFINFPFASPRDIAHFIRNITVNDKSVVRITFKNSLQLLLSGIDDDGAIVEVRDLVLHRSDHLIGERGWVETYDIGRTFIDLATRYPKHQPYLRNEDISKMNVVELGRLFAGCMNRRDSFWWYGNGDICQAFDLDEDTFDEELWGLWGYTHRDAERWQRVNAEVIERELTDVPLVMRTGSSHWAVGWTGEVAFCVFESYEDAVAGKLTEGAQKVLDLFQQVEGLDGCYSLDDERYDELLREEEDEYVKSGWKDAAEDNGHDPDDMLAFIGDETWKAFDNTLEAEQEIQGMYLYELGEYALDGYYGEVYASDEDWTKATEELFGHADEDEEEGEAPEQENASVDPLWQLAYDYIAPRWRTKLGDNYEVDPVLAAYPDQFVWNLVRRAEYLFPDFVQRPLIFLNESEWDALFDAYMFVPEN